MTRLSSGVGALEHFEQCWKERRAIELEQVLLYHPAHKIRDFDLMHAVAKAPLETITIKQMLKCNASAAEAVAAGDRSPAK